MAAPVLRPAVLIDRDGTLAYEVGYINHPSRFKLYSFAVEAVRVVNRAGFLAVLVTNQAGVARGYFTESLIDEVHGAVRAAMASGGARLDGIYYCPHHPSAGEPPYRQDCDCRKPRPGLALRAAAELGIDLARSWVVGDRPGDLELAWNVGARAALVKTGYGLGELTFNRSRFGREPDLISEHLLEAVQAIVRPPVGPAVRAGAGPQMGR